MSNDIDANAFGLPTGVNADPDSQGAGFMYSADDLGVDEDDPIYQATVKAMREQGVEIPKPGEEERPPEMSVEPDADADDGDEEPEIPEPPADDDPPAGEEPPAEPRPTRPTRPTPRPPASLRSR